MKMEVYGLFYKRNKAAPSAKKKMEEVFGNCEIVKRDKGYYLLHSVKR